MKLSEQLYVANKGGTTGLISRPVAKFNNEIYYFLLSAQIRPFVLA